MAYTTIDKPTDYFNTVLYTGNGTARNITTGLTSTDWVWIKRRDGTANHRIFDVVRGVHENLQSNTNNAEQNNSESLTAFGTSTFSLGTDSGGYDVNTSSQTYVSWNWSAGGTASSNSDGSITSTVSANQTAGFSIGTYNGSGSDNTVGHGLGVAPDMIIVKCKSTAHDWVVYHSDLGNAKILTLNATTAAQSATGWQSTSPTSTVFSIDNAANSLNQSGQSFVFYAFASKKGYSKFGSYTGNGNADGTFTYLGFKPAFVMVKPTTTADNWVMIDNKREGYNPDNNFVYANKSFAENDADIIDFTSNGFKQTSSGGTSNRSGDTFIYMAFAESPFVTGASAIPTTAR